MKKQLIFLSAILLVSQAGAMQNEPCCYPSLWQRIKIRTAQTTSAIINKLSCWFGMDKGKEQPCCIKKRTLAC